MAYFLGNCIRQEGQNIGFVLALGIKKAVYLRCLEYRRMNNLTAYGILFMLVFVVIFSAYRCSENNVHQNLQPEVIKQSKTKKLSGQMDCSSSNGHFSVSKMAITFQILATSNHANQVEMDQYLDAWEELIRFLGSMGKAFKFVSSDVEEKIGILHDFRKSANGRHYDTVENMILFEKDNDVINYKDAPSKRVKASGSRTLLRLHRALKFLLILIGKLAKNDDDGKVSVMGYNAYHSSPMSKYHSWIIRKAVGVAVYMLPDRETFIEQLCQDMSKDDLTKTMQFCSENMEKVFEYSEALYNKYEISEIP